MFERCAQLLFGYNDHLNSEKNVLDLEMYNFYFVVGIICICKVNTLVSCFIKKKKRKNYFKNGLNCVE